MRLRSTILVAWAAVLPGTVRAADAPTSAGGPPPPSLDRAAAGGGDDLLRALTQVTPDLDAAVLQRALDSTRCARAAGALPADSPPVLTVIDFSLPSTAPRLWVLDLEARRVLLHTHVAHGQGTGDDLAHAFSNREGSHQSSLGLFKTAERYHGKHGLSLRLDGLDEGLNDAARRRAIVVHGADYATPDFVAEHGRLGRSWGCPAVAPDHIDALVETIEGGAPLFAWYPGDAGLEASRWASCDLSD